MMQFRVTHVILIGLCLMTGSAMAASTVTDLIGDKDGFGVGVLAGQEFLWTTVVPDADGTDQWRYGTQSWTHTYNLGDLDGPITNAELEIFHGGDGWYGAAEVYLNGTSIGFLTDSDATDGSPSYVTYDNLANVDVFDVTAYAGLLTGNDTVEVRTQLSGDGWALDYSELRVSCGPTVPVPGAVVLAALGTGLVGSLRRRRAL